MSIVHVSYLLANFYDFGQMYKCGVQRQLFAFLDV